MKIGALTLLTRWANGGGIDLASWHSRHSLTWRWMASLDWLSIQPRWGSFTSELGEARQRIVRMGPLTVTWHIQRPAWFKDLYFQAAKERDGLAKSIAGLEEQLTEAFDRICTLVESNNEAHQDIRTTVMPDSDAKRPFGIKVIGQFWKQ